MLHSLLGSEAVSRVEGEDFLQKISEILHFFSILFSTLPTALQQVHEISLSSNGNLHFLDFGLLCDFVHCME